MTEIFLPGGTQPFFKLTEIPGVVGGGGGGGEKHPLEWKFQWGGVSKTKTFSVRGRGGDGYFLELQNLKDVSRMFVLSHCVPCSPVSGAYDPLGHSLLPVRIAILDHVVDAKAP